MHCHLLLLLTAQRPPLKPPTTWTSAAMKELKAKLRTEEDSVVTVYRGDVMTVHVPTVPEAKKVCWEFATDGYDIGFGIYFDWTPVTSRSITVHISESSDDEDEEEELEGQPVCLFAHPVSPHHVIIMSLICLPPAGESGSVLTLCFMCFLLQRPSATEISRRVPKQKPTRTWPKSYPSTARTVTCR